MNSKYLGNEKVWACIHFQIYEAIKIKTADIRKNMFIFHLEKLIFHHEDWWWQHAIAFLQLQNPLTITSYFIFKFHKQRIKSSYLIII